MMIMHKPAKVNTPTFSSFLFGRISHAYIEGFDGRREGNWKGVNCVLYQKRSELFNKFSNIPDIQKTSEYIDDLNIFNHFFIIG